MRFIHEQFCAAKICSLSMQDVVRRHGMRAAGFLWLGGTFDQVSLNWADFTTNYAAHFNILSAISNISFGHTNGGVRVSSLTAFTGGMLALAPSIADGSNSALASLALFSLAQYAGFFSNRLTARFENSPHLILRGTLGSPRRILGTLALVSRLPILCVSLKAGQHGLVIPYGSAFLADGFAFASKAPNSQKLTSVPSPT